MMGVETAFTLAGTVRNITCAIGDTAIQKADCQKKRQFAVKTTVMR